MSGLTIPARTKLRYAPAQVICLTRIFSFVVLLVIMSRGLAYAQACNVHCDVSELKRLPHSHTHAESEINEEQGPLLLEATYTGEVISNVRGGLRSNVDYLDNADVVFEADLDQLIHLPHASFHLYGLYNNGSSISADVGDAQTVSNIETGIRSLRLYEAWIDMALSAHLGVRAGLYDLNSEFDSLEASGLFVGSAHGIGSDISQTGLNGPSIFPATSLAVRLEAKFASRVSLRIAALDGVPGNPDHPARTAVRLGNGDGALLIGEMDATLGNARVLLGHWRYSSAFDHFDGTRGGGNSGTYLRAQVPVLKRGFERIEAFMRIGIANGQINQFDRFVSGGMKFTGFIAGRHQDQFGLAFATAITSPAYAKRYRSPAAETAVEITYRAPLTQSIVIQPSMQFIRRPNADYAVPDALVIGVRLELSTRIIG